MYTAVHRLSNGNVFEKKKHHLHYIIGIYYLSNISQNKLTLNNNQKNKYFKVAFNLAPVNCMFIRRVLYNILRFKVLSVLVHIFFIQTDRNLNNEVDIRVLFQRVHITLKKKIQFAHTLSIKSTNFRRNIIYFYSLKTVQL